MNRTREEQLNNLKFYFHQGEFWRDIWRVWLPVSMVGAVALIICLP